MLSLKPKRKEGISARLLPDGNLLLFDSTSDWAYTLSPLGGLVWEFLDGKTARSDLVPIVMNTLQGHSPEIASLDRDKLAGQLNELIDQFDELGLLDS